MQRPHRQVGRARRWWGVWLGLATVSVLSGCTAGGSDGPARATGAPAGTDVAASAPATASPPRGATPAAPVATVDLAAGSHSREAAVDVVGSPDGSALALMGRSPKGPATRLVAVTAGGEITRSVRVPGIRSPWALHLLPDGTALVTGRLADADALGYATVDVATGAARTVTALHLDPATTSVQGRSALSTDGRVLWLVSSTLVDGRFGNLVTGHAVGTGELVDSRDLFAELRGIHVVHQQLDIRGVAGAPDGEVVLAVDVFPPGGTGLWSPTALVYDRQLEPLGPPRTLIPHGAPGRAAALAMAPDGTAYVLVRGPTTGTLLALPPGDRRPDIRLEVAGTGAEQELLAGSRDRVVLPTRAGARIIDASTGGTREVDVGCPGEVAVRGLAAAADGRAWLLGGCFEEGNPPSMLWLIA